MAKSLKDILSGVKSSKVVPTSTGTDAGVDYKPKAPAEQDFVAKHKTEVHADRVGNGEEDYKGNTKQKQEKKHGYLGKKSKEVYKQYNEDSAQDDEPRYKGKKLLTDKKKDLEEREMTSAEKAKEKKLQPSDWEGSTFTISNLGMFGIDQFTAIINPPDACILAVGGIAQEPIVKNGQIVPGNVMNVTLSCDHRVVDGATGAAFLQTLKAYLEEPIRMFV